MSALFTADPMYGGTELPKWMTKILLTPEVQRLRGVRLINSSSPSLAALSDARRYTHTLGVIRLALHWATRHGLESADAQNLACAAMCHDLGTPAFGHVFEYLLSASTGWSHEAAVHSILRGTYRAEGKHHQIFAGRPLALGRTLDDIGASIDEITQLVRGEGPAGALVSGSLDLDNIDNVYRMAHLLGLPGLDLHQPIQLTAALQLNDGKVAVASKDASLVKSWADTRRRVYEVLAFDTSNLQGQAMITECLIALMREGSITEEHWFWTDELLLFKLLQDPLTKDIAQRFVSGDLFEPIFVGWYSTNPSGDDWRRPDRHQLLQQELSSALGIPCVPYVFYDRGTFSKSLGIRILEGGDLDEALGLSRSSSTVVAVLTPRRSPGKRHTHLAIEVLESLGLRSESLRPIPTKESIYDLPGQYRFPI